MERRATFGRGPRVPRAADRSPLVERPPPGAPGAWLNAGSDLPQLFAGGGDMQKTSLEAAPSNLLSISL